MTTFGTLPRLASAAFVAGVLASPRLARADDAGADATASDGALRDAAGDAASDVGSDAAAGELVCPDGAEGCASAPIAYRRRAALPVEFDLDTGWRPASGPLQVRFHAGLAGHTEVRAAGRLDAWWPEALRLRAIPAPGTGYLDAAYGAALQAQVRIDVTISGQRIQWQGTVPYAPNVDFRAIGSRSFDPWAWEPVTVQGSVRKQLIARVPLTSAIIPIPGISGGLSFEASMEMATSYRSTRFTFNGAADPLTATTVYTSAAFQAGPSVDFAPRLEGRINQRANVKIYPGLYVSILGQAFTLDVAEIPVGLGPFDREWLFDPSRATIGLPDVSVDSLVLDFGTVPVGARKRDGIAVESRGSAALQVGARAVPSAPFTLLRTDAQIAAGTSITLPIEFAPVREGSFEQTLTLRTNDPDTAEVELTLRGRGVVGDAGAWQNDAGDLVVDDAGPEGGLAGGGDVQGCGCTTKGRSSSTPTLAFISFGVVVARGGRRRRRRAEPRSGT